MTAQAVYLLIRRAVRDANGAGSVAITAANSHSLDGERWTVSELLDIYNHARKELYAELVNQRERLEGFIKSASITFAAGEATVPTDYMALVSPESGIVGSGGVSYRLRDDLGKMLAGNNPEVTDSTTEKHIVYIDNKFKGQPTLAGTATIRYFGLTDWVVADITTATVATELFLDTDIPRLVEIASLIAQGVPIPTAKA